MADGWGQMMAEVELWLALLQKQLENKSVAQIATEIGYSRPTVSAIINQIATSPYVSGKASTKPIQARVISVYGNYVCPHLSKRNERETWVSGEECRQYAHADPPTGNRQQAEHWQACRGCEKRPPELTKRAFVPRGPKQKVVHALEKSQQELEL